MAEDKRIIYFDHAATTKPLPEVATLYGEVINKYYANPSSVHQLGIDNNRLLEGARKEILETLGMKDHQVIFTSGATESNNLAIKGYMHRYKNRGNHIIVSAIEHPSILNTINSLAKEGFEVTIIPVDKEGKVSLPAIQKELKPTTILVSIMAVNNEVGAIEPIKDIATFLKAFPAIRFHVDAVQGIGKVDLPFNDIDLLTISMHKLGGLKGSGLLIKRKAIELTPIQDGGGHEYGFRSGTNDLGAAVIANFVLKKTMKDVTDKRIAVYDLAKPLYNYFLTQKDQVVINSKIENPYIINISLLKKKASVFAEFLSTNGIMVSTHSACSSRVNSGSPTLTAMGKSDVVSKNAIRISLSTTNTIEEINRFIEVFDFGLKRLKG